MNESVYMLLLLIFTALCPIIAFGILVYFISWQLGLLCLAFMILGVLLLHLYNCREF